MIDNQVIVELPVENKDNHLFNDNITKGNQIFDINLQELEKTSALLNQDQLHKEEMLKTEIIDLDNDDKVNKNNKFNKNKSNTEKQIKYNTDQTDELKIHQQASINKLKNYDHMKVYEVNIPSNIYTI